MTELAQPKRSILWLVPWQLLLLCVLIGCGEKNGTKSVSAEEKNEGSKSNEKSGSDVRVLFIGNSHTTPVPALLRKIFDRMQPERKTHFRKSPGMGFLVDQVRSTKTIEMIRDGDWDFVVLQAQKYSSTGRRTYPTTGAIELSRIAKESGAKILMYPEWSRRGVPEEYARIRAIHDSIAKETGAFVAPIGEGLLIKYLPGVLKIYENPDDVWKGVKHGLGQGQRESRSISFVSGASGRINSGQP